MVLEVRQMHGLEVSEQIVPHAVLGLPRCVEDPPAADAAKHALETREGDHQQREPCDDSDRVGVGARRERVHDASDKERRQHGDERAQADEEDAERESELVLAEVVEEGGAKDLTRGRFYASGSGF